MQKTDIFSGTLVSLLFAVSASVATAQSEDSTVEIQEAPGLQLPEDLAAKANQDAAGADGAAVGDFQIIERRINGRLERVTVKRSNGPDGIYENREVDSMFSKEADELGEVQNVRRWTIGSW